MKKYFSDKYFLGVLVLIIAFIIFKIPYLSLPYYWDEGWFSYATHAMYDNGLRLLPDAIPVELSRGHPVLFHFFAAAWMRIFGTSIIASHTFPLFLSVCLILVLYITAKKIFSPEVGFISCIVFSLQQIFLAQSSFLLLEVMLSLFAVLTLFAYLTSKKILYILSGTLLLMTKEPGIIVVISIGLHQLLLFLFDKQNHKTFQQYFKELLIATIPVFIVSIYFSIQKIMFGWFFFPLHLALMNYDIAVVLSKLETYAAYLFIYYGRNVLSLFFILSIIFYFIFRNKNMSKIQQQTVLLFAIFIVAFLFFASLNFFSPRYILCVFAPFVMIVVFIIHSTFINHQWVKVSIFIIIISVSGYYITQRKSNADHNLGYADAVSIHQQTVKFCESENLFNRNIYAHFLMRMDLTNPITGYLENSNRRFNHVSEKYNLKTEYIIQSNIESETYTLVDSLKKAGKLTLIKSFKKNKAWTEIYKVN